MLYIAVIKHLTRTNMGKKGFTLYNSVWFSIQVRQGNSLREELETETREEHCLLACSLAEAQLLFLHERGNFLIGCEVGNQD